MTTDKQPMTYYYRLLPITIGIFAFALVMAFALITGWWRDTEHIDNLQKQVSSLTQQNALLQGDLDSCNVLLNQAYRSLINVLDNGNPR